MITQTSSTYVYENRWMKVREDGVRFPDGSDGIYGVVEKVDFVIIIPRHADGRFEMVEQYRYPVGGRFWEFPQGAWETRPDVPLLDVAHGELGEETGLKAANMHKLGTLHQASGYSTQHYNAYLATGLSQGETLRDHEEQDMITSRFSRAEIKTMISSGQIMDQTTVSALGLLMLFEDTL
jgi:ADP-ribose pyrophosphatase